MNEMGWNLELLDRHVAPGISVFTACDAPEISQQHPQAPHWLANHFLNSILRGTFKDKFRPYALNQIYRATVAFADYSEAKALTAKYLSSSKTDNPDIQAHFRALARWESCLLSVQISIDVMSNMKNGITGERVFKKKDGTPAQRVWDIANTVKHFGEDIAEGRLSQEDTVPMWLTNAGFKTRVYTNSPTKSWPNLSLHSPLPLTSYKIPCYSRRQMLDASSSSRPVRCTCWPHPVRGRPGRGDRSGRS